jgi:hypothetical protein
MQLHIYQQFITKILVLSIILTIPSFVTAQLIPIKTIPVATGDQFLIYPSQNLSLAGLSLAVNDSLLDPFVNPARGNLIQGSRIVSNPSAYSISDDLGSAQTFPLAILSRSESWFGTVSLAVQELTPSATNSELYADGNGVLGNYYISASVGRQLAGSDISMGLSCSWARLKSIGGVEYLYGNASRIEQNGKMFDVRLGMVANLDDKRTLESTVVYNRYDVTHLTSQNFFEPRFIDDRIISRVPGGEMNQDITHTLGLDLGYTQPLSDTGWQLGGLVTVNYKSHPKIPNYTLMNIARDPGYTWAYNIGFGLADEIGGSIVGFDFIYEPIWSHTWADAAEPIYYVDELTSYVSDKTVDNYFTFSNWIMRVGFRVKESSQAIDLGLEVHRISYDLLQKDYRVNSRREQYEEWYEYTFTLGFNMFFKPFQIGYQGRATLGTGIPLTSTMAPNWASERSASFFADFLPAPNGALSVREAIVLSHRIILSIPIGGS